MDLKGQYLCERVFLSIMWSVTILSIVLTFVLDNVFVMFITFASGLGASTLVSCQQLYCLACFLGNPQHVTNKVFTMPCLFSDLCAGLAVLQQKRAELPAAIGKRKPIKRKH